MISAVVLVICAYCLGFAMGVIAVIWSVNKINSKIEEENNSVQ